MIRTAPQLFADEPVVNTLGTFEIASALLGAMLICISMVGMLEQRNRTILAMSVDPAAVLSVFALGLLALEQAPTPWAPESTGQRDDDGG